MSGEDNDDVYMGRVKVKEINAQLRKLGLNSPMTMRPLQCYAEEDLVPDYLLHYYKLLFRQRTFVENLSDAEYRPPSILRRKKQISFNERVTLFSNTSVELATITTREHNKKYKKERYPVKIPSPRFVKEYVEDTTVPLQQSVIANDLKPVGTREKRDSAKRKLELPETNYRPGIPVVRLHALPSTSNAADVPLIIRHHKRIKQDEFGESSSKPANDISILSTARVTRSHALSAARHVHPTTK